MSTSYSDLIKEIEFLNEKLSSAKSIAQMTNLERVEYFALRSKAEQAEVKLSEILSEADTNNIRLKAIIGDLL